MKTPALLLQGLPAVSRMSINLQENDLILWLNRSLDSNLIERIIYIDDDNNTAFLFNIHARQGFPYPILIAEIVEAISKGKATKRPKDPWSSLNHEENLTDSQIYHRDRRWDIIKSLVGQEPDIYYEHLRVSLIQEFVNHYNQQKKTGKLEATTVYEYLKRYWARGKTKNALVPNSPTSSALTVSNKVTHTSNSTHNKNLSFNKLCLFTLTILILPVLIIGGYKFNSALNSDEVNELKMSQSQGETAITASNDTTFTDITQVPTGTFNYGGSTTWTPILKLVNPQIQKDFPQLKLHYSIPTEDKPGSSTGIKRLLQGEIDYAVSSRPLRSKEYSQAFHQGFSLRQYQIGIDGIAISVNHSLPIDGIELESLKQIYLGEITNWNELGGPDREIVPFSRRPEASGTVGFFEDTVLERKEFGSVVNFVNSTTEGLRQVNSNPNGIYYGSASEIVPQCSIKTLSVGVTQDELVAPYSGEQVPQTECPQKRNQINLENLANGNYPITRHLFVIVKHNGQKPEKIGESYVKLLLTNQGRKLVEKAGFVPVKKIN